LGDGAQKRSISPPGFQAILRQLQSFTITQRRSSLPGGAICSADLHLRIDLGELVGSVAELRERIFAGLLPYISIRTTNWHDRKPLPGRRVFFSAVKPGQKIGQRNAVSRDRLRVERCCPCRLEPCHIVNMVSSIRETPMLAIRQRLRRLIAESFFGTNRLKVWSNPGQKISGQILVLILE